MAGRESYIFNVDAETRNAEQKLENIYKKMNDIDKISAKGKGNFDTVSQKDMTQSMEGIRAVTMEYQSLKREIEEVYQKLEKQSMVRAPKNSSDEYKRQVGERRQASAEEAKSVQKDLKQMEQQYQRILDIHRETADFQQTPTKSHSHAFNSNDLNNYREAVMAMAKDTDPAIERVEKLKHEMRELKKLDSRTTSDARRTQASGYMSFQQSKSFEADMQVGIVDNEEKRKGNLEQLGSLSEERRKRFDEVKEIEKSPGASDEEIHRKVALQEEIAQHDKEMKLRQEWNKALERSIQDSEKKLSDVQAVDPAVKPERGTTRGMMYERAPSVGLALTGAVAATFGALYSKGGSAKSGVQDDVISLAQRTDQDNSNYQVRKGAEEMGLADRLGFSAQEMLAFEEIYLSTSGLKGGSQEDRMEDLMTAAQSQAEFSRTTGVSSDTTRDFFGDMFQTGAVSGNQVKDIQDGFIGAIEQSGMAGREEEQLTALQGLVAQNAQGRQISSDDIRHLMGIQQVFASSENRSLQGEQGGQLLSGLDAGIKGAANDPQLRMMMGQGSDPRYQGVEGLGLLTERLEEGLSNQENLDRMIDIATGTGENETEQAVVFQKIAQQMGAEATMEQSREIIRMGKGGDLDAEAVERLLESNEEIGKNIGEEKRKSYDDMKESTQNQSDSVTEQKSSGLHDLGDIFRKTNESLGILPVSVYALTAAVASLAVAVAATAASFGIGQLIRGATAGRLFGRGRKAKTPPTRTGADGKSAPKTPILGPDGKPLPRSTTSQSKQTPKTGGWFSRMGDKFKGDKGEPKAGGGFFSKIFGDKGGGTPGGDNPLGKSGKFGKGLLGKALLPLGIGLGVAEVASAEKGKKVETAGEVAGGVGGWMAGAGVGAAAGTAIFPGIGTAIGALIGGISGSSIGSYVGKGIGKVVSNVGEWFGGSKASAAELDLENDPDVLAYQASTDKAKDNMGVPTTAKASASDPDSVTGNKIEGQVERETATQRHETENIRAENIAGELENLTLYEKLLSRATEILAIARQQNGIFGSAGNGGSEGGSGSLGYVEGGGFTSGDLTKHDLVQTDATLTAEDLDAWINSKASSGSVMRGMGEAFMKAGQESGMDPRYLVAHAAHETGWGSSNIAKEKGNMYGIGAFDASPYASAYGYDNTEAGIIEGAKWIKENYYDKGQTDLNSMRHNGGKHEYATDPQWDTKIGNIMQGAPAGSGTAKVESTVNVTVKANEDVVKAVNNSSDLAKAGKKIEQTIYASMNYHAQERVRA